MYNESLAFEALVEWNFWGSFKEELKQRECKVKLPERNLIFVIKGVRRCGKSRLSYLLAREYKPKETLLINFEDPRLKEIESKEILKIVEMYQRKVNTKQPKLLVLDEVQNIIGWENVARLYNELKKTKVIVTGSSSKLMSEEYASVLSGRYLDFELFPLSFREVLLWNKTALSELEIYKNKLKILNLFDNYLKHGGFPEVILTNSPTEKREILRRYFNDILIKDVVRRFGIREIEKTESLGKIYLTNVSSLQSFNKLKNITKLSLDSIERFSKYFKIARLFFFVPKFSYSVTQQILNPKKVYTIDTGFYSALGFKFSENLGKLMENSVAIELFRKASYWYRNLEIYYYRDYQQHEVDFILKDAQKIKQLIQVTYANGKDEIDRREIRALLRASKQLKCNNLLVITWDYEAKEEFKGKTITFKPLWKWLLNIK